MPTPIVAGTVLRDAALEQKLLATRGVAAPGLADQLQAGIEEREIQVLVAISILRWGYVTKELQRQYPWIPVRLLMPPATLTELENSDAALVGD